MPKHNFGLGWVPDLPDHRDLTFAAPIFTGPLPAAVSLRGSRFMPPIWNQGKIGSCTGHGVGRIYKFAANRQGIMGFDPSRLFLYYNARVMEHSVGEDAGAQIRDVVKQAAKLGVANEKTWPYDISKFADRPPLTAFQEAMRHQSLVYRRIPRNLTSVKACLASGYPFTFGFTVYDSIYDADQGGNIPMPSTADSILGGHCVTCTGYNDKRQVIELANSWGEEWGDKGYGTLPYAYLLDANLSDDFWMMTLVENDKTQLHC